MFDQILSNVTSKRPLVHCITNYVTVNDCANIIAACGASPIMADDHNEVEDITSICNGLVLNIGTLNERTIQSMIIAGKKANALRHTVVLDPVGAGASQLRTQTTYKLLDEIKFSVIRGNISEIKTVALGSGTTKGIDADASDTITEENLSESIEFVKALSKRLKSVIAITGAIDLVANEDCVYVIRNGNPMMSTVIGTGCMLSSMIGAFCSANEDQLLDAVAAAVCVMGLAGEIAYERLQKAGDGAGSSTYRIFLIDAINTMSWEVLKNGMKIDRK
ncbi:unnamed protein product [Adineta steineri]|uniref:hydroxyethylthiazole kinase n=1 Tax=Adineta steineri TaxID=433720 RepID=A0A814M9W6_9BILA|nr:unnamed protein product [Adineta steineri]CAF4000822.1 unnamed protein product [Adineta steineri]